MGDGGIVETRHGTSLQNCETRKSRLVSVLSYEKNSPEGNSSVFAKVETCGLHAEGTKSAKNRGVSDTSATFNFGNLCSLHTHSFTQLRLSEADLLASLFDGLANSVLFHSSHHFGLKFTSFRCAGAALWSQIHLFPVCRCCQYTCRASPRGSSFPFS